MNRFGQCQVSLILATLAIVAGVGIADDKARTMRRTAISNTRLEAYLVDEAGVIKFHKKAEYPETLWNLRFEKGHVAIAKKASGGEDGPFLGIDIKTKQLALFDKAGVTTNWQLKAVRPAEISPPRPFEALLYMKIGTEELRLSSDEDGHPIVGGKADVLSFLVEGA